MNRIFMAGLLFAAVTGAGHAAEPKRTVSDVERSLTDLARETEDERRSLEQRYSDKRRALVESEDWKGLSRVERRAKLGALNDELKAEEARLKEGYKLRREGLVRERQALEDTTEVESSAL